MTTTPSPFEHGLRLMEAQQERATRSLINLIEMISTTSHRYAQDTTAFTRDAMALINEASTQRDAQALSDLQKKWAETCVKYSQNQTRATMAFVEQCGLQALNVATKSAQHTDQDTHEPDSSGPGSKE